MTLPSSATAPIRLAVLAFLGLCAPTMIRIVIGLLPLLGAVMATGCASRSADGEGEPPPSAARVLPAARSPTAVGGPHLDSTDVVVRRHMEERGIPGVSLVVLRNGEIVKQAAYGRASLELNVAATPETVFPYASVAKIFTGTAILQLVQADRFSLNNGIADLLPDLPEAWGTVSVRQLLDHTSGLPDLNEGRTLRNPFLAPLESREQVLTALISQPVQLAHGADFAYNQSNYLLLALLLERYDGRTIDEYVGQEFAVPLGLASLAYGDSRVVVPGRASWYSAFDFSSGAPRPTEPRPLWIEYPPWLHTAAGLNGTAADLARFVAAVASDRLLAPELRRDMWTAARSAGGTVFQFEGTSTGSGLGWWVGGDPAHPWVGMGGGASGVLRHYVDDNLTIVVLTNLQGAQPETLLERIASLHLF